MKKHTITQPEHDLSSNRKLRKIVAQYRHRLENPQNPRFKRPFSSALGLLKREAYRLAIRLERKASENAIGVEERGKYSVGRESVRLVLAAIFEQLGKTTKGDRNRLRLNRTSLTAHNTQGEIQ